MLREYPRHYQNNSHMTILIFSFNVIKYKEYNDSKEFNTLFSKISEIQILKDVKTQPLNLFCNFTCVFTYFSIEISDVYSRLLFYRKVLTFFIDVAGHFDKIMKGHIGAILRISKLRQGSVTTGNLSLKTPVGTSYIFSASYKFPMFGKS